MSNTTTGYRTSERYGVFTAKRSHRVKLQAVTIDADGVTGRDFSAAGWQLRLRIAPLPLVTPVVFDVNVEMTKVVGDTDPGDTGIAEANIVPPSARDSVHVEFVAVDTNTVDATTPSGKREHALGLPWQAIVVASPSPS